METFGFIDHELRGALRTAAESHTNQSCQDLGLSSNARRILIAATVQTFYERLSVAVQKGTANALRRATFTARDALRSRHAPPLAVAKSMGNARALDLIHTTLRRRADTGYAPP